MSASSHPKTSVLSFPFIVAKKKNWEIKYDERTTTNPLTPSRTHKHRLHMCTAVSEPSPSHRFYWLLCGRICDMEAHMLALTQSPSFKTLKENKERAKRLKVREVKTLHWWRVSLWTVCVSPHWDLSNPCFIIGSRFGIRIGAKLGQSRLISRRSNMTDFTPPQSKKNMRSGGNFLITVIHWNLLELVLKLDTLLPLLFQADFETFQPVVPLYAGWSQSGSLLFQVQHRSLEKRREEWNKLPHEPASKDNYGL